MHKTALMIKAVFCFIFFSLIYRTPALRQIRTFQSVSAYSIAYFSEDQGGIVVRPNRCRNCAGIYSRFLFLIPELLYNARLLNASGHPQFFRL